MCRGEGCRGRQRGRQSWTLALLVTGTLDLRHAVILDTSLCLSEPQFPHLSLQLTPLPLTPGLLGGKKEVVDVKLLCKLWELRFLGWGANIY